MFLFQSIRAHLCSSVVLLSAMLPALAGVEFGSVENYPNLGFMMPRLEHAKAEPVPMPLARTFLTVGAPLAREDRFDPYELWYNDQCRARWRAPSGHRLAIGRATHRLPDFSGEAVSRERFAAVGMGRQYEINPREREQVDEWVATFAGVPVYEPEKLKLNGFALDEVWAYPCAEPGTLVYAFRPRRVGSGSAHGWFCAVLSTDGTTAGAATAPAEEDADADEQWFPEIAVPAEPDAALRKAFEEQFIGRIALPSRTSRGKGVEAEEVSVRKKGEREPEQALHPVRAEARGSIENYDDWWFAETDGYIILSDVHTGIGKSLVERLKKELPALRKAYAALVPPLVESREVALLRLFQSREDYVRYVGKDHEWSGGLWMPGRRELVLFLKESEEEVMKVVQHEAFHQYLSHVTCMLGAAPWLNEGHACLFENAEIGKKGNVTLPEDEARCALLTENLELAVTLLPTMLWMDYADFYDGTDAARQLKYAIAWGLVYYFQKGIAADRQSPFKDVLEDYMEALSLTRDTQQASLLAFAEIDMAKLQSDFQDFWLRRRSRAASFNPLGK